MTTTYYNHWRDVPTARWRWKNFSPAEIACRGTGSVRVTVLAIATISPTGCATGASESRITTVCSPVVEYSREFQAHAADDLT